MIQFLRRRWHHTLVALGLRKPHPPLTPTIIAREALALLEATMAQGPVIAREQASVIRILPLMYDPNGIREILDHRD